MHHTVHIYPVRATASDMYVCETSIEYPKPPNSIKATHSPAQQSELPREYLHYSSCWRHPLQDSDHSCKAVAGSDSLRQKQKMICDDVVAKVVWMMWTQVYQATTPLSSRGMVVRRTPSPVREVVEPESTLRFVYWTNVEQDTELPHSLDDHRELPNFR